MPRELPAGSVSQGAVSTVNASSVKDTEEASPLAHDDQLLAVPGIHVGDEVPSSSASTQTHTNEKSEESDERRGQDTPTNHDKGIKLSDLTDQTNLLPFRMVVSVFLGLSVCIVGSTLDQTIIATSLPTIASHFHAGSVSSFIPSTYLLTSTAFQPLYGRFSDIFGRKAALCLAMSVFMLGNLAAGFSRNISEVIIFRGVAGAGGGGIISMVQIIVSDVVSLRDRGKYQGIMGVVIVFGFGCGPLIGGTLSEKVTWRWCFWITIPLSFAAILVVTYILPLKRVEGNIKKKLLAIDYIGTALTLGGCTLLMLPLIWVNIFRYILRLMIRALYTDSYNEGGVTFPWKSAIVLATLLSGIAVVSIFCLWEWKGASLPIVPMYIFKHMTVTGVYISMFVNGFIYNCSLYYLPQFFQVSLGYSPIRSGVFIIPVLVSQMIASFASGLIVSRTGRYRSIIYVGFATWAVGCGVLSTITESTKKAVLVVFMLVSGIGGGQTLQTTTVAAQASVSRRDMSVVTAVRNFMRQLGGALSLAIGSTIINNSLRSRMKSLHLPTSAIEAIIDDPTILATLVSPGANATTPALISPSIAREVLKGYNNGFHSLFILNAVLAAICVVVSAVMIKHKELTRADEAEMRRQARERYEKKRQRKKASAQDVELGVIEKKQEDATNTEQHEDLVNNDEECAA